jgi:hypothetical protein
MTMEIEYEPRFLDEAVLRAAAARPDGRLFFREREAVFRIPDPEARGRAFDALNVVWAERFEITRPLREALAEQPLVTDGVARCGVGRALDRRSAGAELLVRPPAFGEPAAAGRRLRLLLPPELLLAPDRLGAMLRRELLHVADMLDPAFGYAPRLPGVRGGPAVERLMRDRYRVAWDVTVDGRLARAGKLPATVRDARAADFQATFAMLGASVYAVFTQLFEGSRPTHAALVELVVSVTRGAGRASGACSLCGFPTAELEPDPAALPAVALADIAADFPEWRPADGCCRQCADLYRARELSRTAEAELPGIR